MDKSNVARTHNGRLFILKKRKKILMCYTMSEDIMSCAIASHKMTKARRCHFQGTLGVVILIGTESRTVVFRVLGSGRWEFLKNKCVNFSFFKTESSVGDLKHSV